VGLRLFNHAYHIRQRLHTPRGLRPLERFGSVRVPAVRVLDLRHAGSDFSGRQVVGTGPCGASSDRPDGARFVEPCPPQPHGGTRGLPAMGHRVIGEPLGRQQAEPRGVQPVGDWSSLASMPLTSASVLPSRQRIGWFSPAPDDTRLTPYQKI